MLIGCSTTIASVSASTPYQWLWVLLDCVVISVIALLTERLKRNNRISKAEQVHEILLMLTHQPQPKKAVDQWRSNAVADQAPQDMTDKLRSVELWRRVLFYLMHIPILLITSLPAGALLGK